MARSAQPTGDRPRQSASSGTNLDLLENHNRRQSLRIGIHESLITYRQHRAGSPKNSGKPALQHRGKGIITSRRRPQGVRRRTRSDKLQTTAGAQVARIRAAAATSRQRKLQALSNTGDEAPWNSNGEPAGCRGWYFIKRIIAEAGGGGGEVYLVEWQGVNPRTGLRWPNDCIRCRDVSQAAVKLWEQAKKDGRVQDGVLLSS